MKTSERREKNIKDLAEALEELNIAQTKVNKVLDRIKREDNRENRKEANEITSLQKLEDDHSSTDSSEQQNRIPGTKLRVGDRVRITNANFGQKDTGTITGYNQTITYQWIWIQPSSGPQIKRIAKNIVKL